MKQKNINNMKKSAVAVLVLSMLAGCATPPQTGADTQQQPTTAQTDNPCSVGTTAVAGAALGALIGALAGGKKGALIGAAAGGVLGGAGCWAVNVRSRQIKTAEQTDRDYIRARGDLPAQPTVIAYDVKTDGVGQRGKPILITTTVEVVNGRTQQVQSMEERLVIVSPDGTPFKNGSKPLVATNASGGRFENQFELKIPDGVTQGVYPMRANLLVNGQQVAARDLQTRLVLNDGVATIVASR
jgi:uncharacterized protein YcfJ